MMMRLMIATIGLCGLLCGCGQDTGYLVTPVPLEKEMVERVVAADGGLFVTDRIAVIDVDGLLFNQRDTGGLFGPKDNPVASFIEKMDHAQADSRVKAVVLRINSPGGGVTASDVMYKRVMDFRKARNVPVIAFIEDVGASGGYYIACAADTIMCNPTSITGSIGVIVQMVSFDGTMRKIGVDAKAITSGEFKDMASPLKPLDKKDQELLKAIVDEHYAGFVKVVAAGRPKLTADKVKTLADGRVYTGQQAAANGLVDETGYLQDAVRLARKRSGSRAVKVVMYSRPWGQKQNIHSESPAGQPQVNLININMPHLWTLTQTQFLYLWTGK